MTADGPRLLIPHEHGAWSQLLVPLSLAPPSPGRIRAVGWSIAAATTCTAAVLTAGLR